MTFLERARAGLLIFDGAMGTMIQRHMAIGELPEMLNLTMPEVITAVHRTYLDAGADVIETNTLNANRLKIEKAGHTVDEVVFAAVGCARRAVAGSGREAYVALSMGSTGVMLEPLGELSFEDAYDIYAEMAKAGERAGADLVLIETVSDLHEVKAALLAAKRETRLPVAVTLTFFANGKLLTGADVLTAVSVLEALGADIVGLNCGLGPRQMLSLADQLAQAASVPALINPNAGLPKLVDGESVYAVDPGEFAAEAAELARKGARMIGGCCGTTPEHIAALAGAVKGISVATLAEKNRCVVTSGSKCVEFGGDAVEIADVTGEGIDETLDSALETEAEIILVACSPLPEAVAALQEAVLKPMYLVAGSPAEAERALRRYNGKPIVGIADEGTIAEYIALAKAGGAALAVDSEACYHRAAQALGAKNAFVDCGEDAGLSAERTARGIRTILRGDGEASARVIRA